MACSPRLVVLCTGWAWVRRGNLPSPGRGTGPAEGRRGDPSNVGRHVRFCRSVSRARPPAPADGAVFSASTAAPSDRGALLGRTHAQWSHALFTRSSSTGARSARTSRAPLALSSAPGTTASDRVLVHDARRGPGPTDSRAAALRPWARATADAPGPSAWPRRRRSAQRRRPARHHPIDASAYGTECPPLFTQVSSESCRSP